MDNLRNAIELYNEQAEKEKEESNEKDRNRE